MGGGAPTRRAVARVSTAPGPPGPLPSRSPPSPRPSRSPPLPSQSPPGPRLRRSGRRGRKCTDTTSSRASEHNARPSRSPPLPVPSPSLPVPSPPGPQSPSLELSPYSRPLHFFGPSSRYSFPSLCSIPTGYSLSIPSLPLSLPYSLPILSHVLPYILLPPMLLPPPHSAIR